VEWRSGGVVEWSSRQWGKQKDRRRAQGIRRRAKGKGQSYRDEQTKQPEEPVSKCSILFEVKKGENFNRRNILHISRIKIGA